MSSEATGHREALLSEHVLQSMRDGVVAIDLEGKIIMFNEAAGAILGKAPQDMLGQPFASEFMVDERFDDFNELVLKAVYESEMAHSTEIALTDGDERTDLRISSSFLTFIDRAGARQRIGVVVVFSDITEQRKRRKLKRLFGEYVDPRVVEEILLRGAGGTSQRADMTVSFVDMRDFTGWSERLDADALTALLNRFLAAVTKPIGEAGGMTDKYIGDAAMAAWGPPFTAPASQAADACRAALGQVAAVAALRDDVVAEGLAHGEHLDCGVGIATGDVLTGDIGPPQSRNFTVIGQAVNVAARLQDLAKVYGERIIVAEETRERAGDAFHFKALDRITVRGSVRPLTIYALLGAQGAVSPERLSQAERYERALEFFRAGEFEASRDAFQTLLAAFPDDKGAQRLLERALTHHQAGHGKDWDGIWHIDGRHPSQ